MWDPEGFLNYVLKLHAIRMGYAIRLCGRGLAVGGVAKQTVQDVLIMQ